MKEYPVKATLVSVLILLGISCKKDHSPAPPRKVTFQLYAAKDLSGDHHNITFTLIIRKGQTILFDSILPPMQVQQVPDAAHKIVAEKLVPNNDPADLAVGFLYEIENVGNSWHLEEFKPGETSKLVEFPFQ